MSIPENFPVAPGPPPYEHTHPEHPGSGCPGCTPLSRELEWQRAEVERLTRERDGWKEKAEAAWNRSDEEWAHQRKAHRQRDRLAAALREIEGVPVSWDKTELLQAFGAVKSICRAALAEVKP